MKQLLFLLVLTGGLFLTASAQQVALTGLVNDKQSGEPLPGATIEISGKNSPRVISGLNGSFVLRKLPAGTYKIKVFFIGYNAYETSVELGDKPIELHIELERKKNELTEVMIGGMHDRGSESGAQLADRRAIVVQNSVSARAIEISPDLSVANVTQRISGVTLERSTNGEGQYVIIRGMDKRYIYTLVNGIKIPSPDNKNRYVPLDIFPADLLDRLEIVKALTPDKEGDGIGGSVNMIMKDAPSKLSLKANAAIGFADKFFTQDFTKFDYKQNLDRSPRYTNGPTYQASMNNFPNGGFVHSSKHNPYASVFGLSVGDRFLNDKLGVMAAGSYQNNYRNVNSIFFKTETDLNNGSAIATDVQPRQYSIQQERSGVHTKLDYKINSNNKINLYAGFMNLVKNEYRYAIDTNIRFRTGAGTGSITMSNRNLHDVQQIFNTTLGGEHNITDRFGFNWTGAYSKAVDNRPDEATLGITTGISKDSMGNFVHAPVHLNSDSYREFAHSSDEDKSGYLNFIYKSTFGEAKLNWQIGGMYRNKNRTSSYDSYDLRPTPSTQLYDGNINNNHFYVYNGEGSYTDPLNYTAKENVGAAYAMVNINFRQWQLTGGARYEHTELSWTTNQDAGDGKTGSISYYDVLPSVHIKYNLGAKQALRISYYSAISRPNFYEVIPSQGTGGNTDADYSEKGNPYLKRATADNFDLRYEFYPKGLDQFTAGMFYKKINTPIEFALIDFGTNTYYMPANFGNASNYGFEADLIKYWRWFGIKANYTFTNSEITTSKILRYSTGSGQSTKPVNQTRPLQGQSKHVANISLLVKDDNKLGLNAQLAFGYTSDRINTVSQYLDNDIWQKGFSQMDFSIEKRLAKQWFVYAKVNNILNTPYQLEIRQPYLGGGVTGNAPYQEVGKNLFVRKDTYGANYLLGVKFKL